MIYDLIKQTRSYRRFHQEISLENNILTECINCARLSASAGNIQPLKYIITNDPNKNNLIFPHLSWASYLKEWPGPSEGERPSAYITILGDTTISKNFGCDHGIAAQSIRLYAAEKGFGGCIIGLINKSKLSKVFNLSPQYQILLVIALGKPKETVIIEDMGTNNNIQYWRDREAKHHVPKRKFEDIVIR